MTSINTNSLILSSLAPVCNFTSMIVPTLPNLTLSTQPANTLFVDNVIQTNIIPIYKSFTLNTITSSVNQIIGTINPRNTGLNVCPTAGGTLVFNSAITSLTLNGTLQGFSSVWNSFLTTPNTSSKMLSGTGAFSGGTVTITFPNTFDSTPTVVLSITQTAVVPYVISAVSTSSFTALCATTYNFNYLAIGT